MGYNAFQMHESLQGDKKKKDDPTKPKHSDLTTDDLIASENANKLVRAYKQLNRYNKRTIRKNERQENKFRRREREELAGTRPVKFTTAQQQYINREALRYTTPTYTRR